MSQALKKTNRLCIPPRDKSKQAPPRAAKGDGSHIDQINNAFAFGFARYDKAMEELSKV
ncbi:hypothetical protein [Xenorhabdus budapestensis]|uniref:Bacteriophage protein n=1 Tax=Xenorhabdus budapestensis TaxID=290110 RepID=A0A2D0IX88_XENBU|nr:hypothetical protein [Xenorhabdus budapestensis]PHM26557.1 hypothetical protein Xbud_02584 [Xenorhabdus budapestensis]